MNDYGVTINGTSFVTGMMLWQYAEQLGPEWLRVDDVPAAIEARIPELLIAGTLKYLPGPPATVAEDKPATIVVTLKELKYKAGDLYLKYIGVRSLGFEEEAKETYDAHLAVMAEIRELEG